MFSKKEFAIVSKMRFIIWTNFMLSWVEHEKSFMTSGPGSTDQSDCAAKRYPIFLSFHENIMVCVPIRSAYNISFHGEIRKVAKHFIRKRLLFWDMTNITYNTIYPSTLVSRILSSVELAQLILITWWSKLVPAKLNGILVTYSCMSWNMR